MQSIFKLLTKANFGPVLSRVTFPLRIRKARCWSGVRHGLDLCRPWVWL